MKHLIKTIGKGVPKIALVACVHGDEIMGMKVIKNLFNIKPQKGSISFIIAHPQALKSKKRYLQQDLNRSFPGNKKGVIEERIAYRLKKILRSYDLVLDIHATSSNFHSMAVTTRFDEQMRELLKYVPIKRVALVYKTAFGGNEMIAHCPAGISLDYGPDKTGRNYKTALKHIKIILRNLGIISGSKVLFKRKELYKVSGSYLVPRNFKQKKGLKEFRYIRKGQIVGYVNGKNIKAKIGFYPIFLGRGRYKETLALIAQKKSVGL